MLIHQRKMKWDKELAPQLQKLLKKIPIKVCAPEQGEKSSELCSSGP